MNIFSANVNSNVESIRKKASEKDFYKYMNDKMPGLGITKIVPLKGIYFDLLYVEKDKAGLFKFMDTNEDTFSILDREILEVMEEEYQEVENYIKETLPSCTISYHFVMPYVDLKSKHMSKKFIIDNKVFEGLINDELSIYDYLSNNEEEYTEKIVWELAKEYFVTKKDIDKKRFNSEIQTSIKFKNLELKAGLMDKEQIENINNFRYGSTLVLGSSGTGKTRAMVSKLIKIARLYPKDNFLYLTFDKQISSEINSYMKNLFPDLKNVKIINYHQFILLLGKKYNLRLNNKSKYNFNKEFEKIFVKVAQIYNEKRYFKGVFVDEAENFELKDLKFLRSISYLTRNFLYVSYDKAKQMSHLETKTIPVDEYEYDNILTFNTNYRNSICVGTFNAGFQNNIETFSLLELKGERDYFIPFNVESRTAGDVRTFEYASSPDMMNMMLEHINEYKEQGYNYSDMCIIYPFNEKVLKGKKYVYSKHLVKKYLEENDIIFNFADDETSNLYNSQGITLSNIYNVTNLEYKIVFLCQLDVLYNSFSIENKINTRKMINIIYTATSRATEKLCLYLREDETRPGIIDLLKISSID